MSPRAPALPPDERRAALVAATLPLVRERGGAVSTREIAQAAGVAEGTIFRVFGSKAELVQACVHRALATDELVTRLTEVDAALPLEQRLTAAVDLLQRHLQGVFSLLMTMRSSGQPLGGPREVAQSERGERSETAIQKALVALVGDDAGRLRLPVTRLLDFLRMLTLSSVHPMMTRSSATPAEIVDVVLHGVLGDAPTRRTNGTTRRRPRGT